MESHSITVKRASPHLETPWTKTGILLKLKLRIDGSLLSKGETPFSAILQHIAAAADPNVRSPIPQTLPATASQRPKLPPRPRIKDAEIQNQALADYFDNLINAAKEKTQAKSEEQRKAEATAEANDRKLNIILASLLDQTLTMTSDEGLAILEDLTAMAEDARRESRVFEMVKIERLAVMVRDKVRKGKETMEAIKGKGKEKEMQPQSRGCRGRSEVGN